MQDAYPALVHLFTDISTCASLFLTHASMHAIQQDSPDLPEVHSEDYIKQRVEQCKNEFYGQFAVQGKFCFCDFLYCHGFDRIVLALHDAEVRS